MEKLHWYEYKHRGLSIGCQPKGWLKHDESKGRFGWIAYGRELTADELSEYELVKVE